MLFFPKIDEQATISNATRKLNEYARWREVANEKKEQKITQTFSFLPRSENTKKSNMIEDIVISRERAMTEIEAIENAFNCILDPVYREILYYKFLKLPFVKSDIEIADLIGYQSSRYFELKRSALLSFANCFKNGALLVYKSYK